MTLTVISLLKNYDRSCVKSYESLYSQSSKKFEHVVIYKSLQKKYLYFLKKKFIRSKFIKENKNKLKNKFFGLNQAINISTGKYIMLLHSDDVIVNKNLIMKINKLSKIDLDFITTGVKIVNNEDKILRKWIFTQNNDNFGFSDIPPHTGFIYKKKLHKIYGLYSLNYPICADFDFMLKFFSNKNKKIKFKIIDGYSISMSFGGDSTKLKNLLRVFNEDRLIFKFQRKNFPTLRSIYKKIRKINQFL